MDLTVAYYSDAGLRDTMDLGFQRRVKWDTDLVTGYKSWFLPGGSAILRIRQQRAVLAAIVQKRFDVLWIHGYNSLAAASATVAAFLVRMPVLIREEATLLDERPIIRRSVKALILRLLARMAYGLYIGQESRRFFEAYGFRKERLFFAPYTVDNDYFRQQATLLQPKKDALKAEFGIRPDLPVVLFAGKLIPKKDPWTLITAFEDLQRRMECALLIAGDGPLRYELGRHAEAKQLSNLHFSGFLNQTEISKAYAAADVIVLPSVTRETWGLVVNEAMNFAIPVITSDRVGCATDLVEPGINGMVFPAGSPASLTACLFDLLSDPKKVRSFGLRSRQRIEAWSLDRTANGIVSAVLEVSRARPNRRGGIWARFNGVVPLENAKPEG